MSTYHHLFTNTYTIIIVLQKKRNDIGINPGCDVSYDWEAWGKFTVGSWLHSPVPQGLKALLLNLI